MASHPAHVGLLARLAAIALATALVLAAAANREVRAASGRHVVPCDQVIGQVGSGTEAGYRIVLGVVSVPPRYLDRVVALHTRPWGYWRKAGLALLAGPRAVDVSVPPAWRRRAAIIWGNGPGAYSALRIAGCPQPSGVWNGYAGGFYLRAPWACVPVTFRVGSRTATVRFGVGRPCGRHG